MTDVTALVTESVETLAEALGAMPEAYNVFDYTDEATTTIVGPVDQIAAALIASGAVRPAAEVWDEALREARVERLVKSDQDWYIDYANIVTLVTYMASEGYTALEIAYAVEKPWKHADVFTSARTAQQDGEDAS